MGQEIDEMIQRAPVLTLDPFGETKEEIVEAALLFPCGPGRRGPAFLEDVCRKTVRTSSS